MKPNILLINCDDLGYGDLSCYGSTKNNTPVLDKLAKEGIRFTDFYVASPVCSPSRASLMTGCYPPRISCNDFLGNWVLFPGDSVGLNPDETTIADVLRNVGYSTMLVGKWHCGDQKDFLPTNHGFDSYYGLPYSNDMGIQKGARRTFPPLPLVENEEIVQEQPDQAALTERYLEQSIKFIRRNKENPFFLYLAHMYVHVPVYVPYQMLKEGQTRYSAGVEYVDLVTGAILDELEKLGLRENTLILFTSDNGSRDDNGQSNAPLRGTKATTWEGGQRVPLIANWKGKIEGDKQQGGIISSIDLCPTLAAIAGADMPQDKIIDGENQSELLLGNSEKSIRDTFLYFGRYSLEAVRRGDYKLHVLKGKQEVKYLYNLREDIAEKNNIYDEYPNIVHELNEIIKRAREDVGDIGLGIEGKNVRPIGRVDNPDTLTHYDENHHYIIAEYDLEERG